MNIFESWIAKQPIAHRGLHNKTAPENTLSAFELAIAQNYAIELDVRLIDDGNVIVFHDDKLTRLTNIDGFASGLTLIDLEQIYIQGSEQRIPLFSQVLDLVAGRVPLLIEIKNDNKAGVLEQKVIDLLKAYKGEFAVQSFNPFSLEYFKIHAPSIIRGQLSCFYTGNTALSRLQRFALKRMLLNRKVSEPHFIAYDTDTLPNRFAKRYKRLPILAWTVRTEEELERIKPHCTNVIFENIEFSTGNL